MTYGECTLGVLLNYSLQPIKDWTTTYSYHYINYIGLMYFFSPHVPSYRTGDAIDDKTSIIMSSISYDIGKLNIIFSHPHELWSVTRRQG